MIIILKRMYSLVQSQLHHPDGNIFYWTRKVNQIFSMMSQILDRNGRAKENKTAKREIQIDRIAARLFSPCSFFFSNQHFSFSINVIIRVAMNWNCYASTWIIWQKFLHMHCVCSFFLTTKSSKPVSNILFLCMIRIIRYLHALSLIMCSSLRNVHYSIK